jgi:hypothetical protein
MFDTAYYISVLLPFAFRLFPFHRYYVSPLFPIVYSGNAMYGISVFSIHTVLHYHGTFSIVDCLSTIHLNLGEHAL